jgi:hypothetical protein
MNNVLMDSDLNGLPVATQNFVKRICEFGFSRAQIHGIFVLLGLYEGTPATAEEIDQRRISLQDVVPSDREKNMDEQVGEFYDGYDAVINEFYLRLGVELTFRDIYVPENGDPIRIVRAYDYGLLEESINGAQKLADSSRLYWSLIENLGKPTERRNRSLHDAFLCGVFQMLLYAEADVEGSRQLSLILTESQPLVIGEISRSLRSNTLDYFSGLLNLQIPLFYLMRGISQQYAEQMWGFQSSLFFYDQQPIGGVEEASPQKWHHWVMDRAKAFDVAFPQGIFPFSESGVTLSHLPRWGDDVDDFVTIDGFIYSVWGYNSSSLRNYVELAEYKACLIHVIYASLTASRERIH